MDTATYRTAWAILAIGLLTAGCADEGDIAFTNNAEVDVKVQFGDEAAVDLAVNGGGLIYNECHDGPIVVTYADGLTVELEGPACPGQELVVSGSTAELVGR